MELILLGLSPLFTFLKPFHLTGIPIHLTADASHNPDFPGPERKPGEEAPDIQHPVLGILAVDEPDPHQNFSQVFVHAFQFEFIGKARHGGFWCRFTGSQKEFVTYYEDRLGKVQGRKSGGWDCGDRMAVS